TILAKDRKIAIVKRKNEPHKGMWCLPSGFAEIGESTADAALRELEEETGVKGRILGLVDVDSCSNYYYGDLIFLTFEVEQIGGELAAGDDAEAVEYVAVEKISNLAFQSNTKAIEAYINMKKDYWSIVDSFSMVLDMDERDERKKNFISDKLIDLIEQNSELIANLWLNDIISNRSTPNYHKFDKNRLFNRVNRVFAHFSQWLEGSYNGQDIRQYYINLGIDRKQEGFAPSEVISALSIIRKHIWEFALSQGIWQKTKDIYMTLELERRMMLFFDKAAYYVALGYEDNCLPDL
ncbi:MAG: NUDIX domain-containing protein, partial [Desulfobacteraceae bacterium]|nr:NUDIX domain-containing protein [Desulfobacteraceae bacterium]